jgi:hypothetical protein
VNVFVDDAGIQVFVSKEGRNYVSIETLPKRRSFDEAQHDLNMYAIEKKWQRV